MTDFNFNKTIWIFWEQGWISAPIICLACRESWKQQNPDWVLNILSKDNINNYINVLEINNNFWSIEPIQTRSDIIRILLLEKYGGVWVDATTVCIVPLNVWLFDCFDKNNLDSYFVFKHTNYCPSNWFIATHKNCLMITELKKKYTEHFNNNIIAKKYFQFYEDFLYLVNHDNKLKEHYDSMKFMSSHVAKFYMGKSFNDVNINFDPNNGPVLKLCHKKPFTATKTSNLIKSNIITKIFNYLKINISDHIPKINTIQNLKKNVNKQGIKIKLLKKIYNK